MKKGIVKKLAALVAVFASAIGAFADGVVSSDSVAASTGTLAANGNNWTASALVYLAPTSNDSLNRSETGWYAGIRRTWALSYTGSSILNRQYTGTKANDTKASFSDNAGRTISEFGVYKSLAIVDHDNSPDGSGLKNDFQAGGVTPYMKTTDWNVWVTPEIMHGLAQEGKDYEATLTIGGATYTITVPKTVVLKDNDNIQWYPAVAVVDGKVYGDMPKAVESALVAAMDGKDMEFYVEPTGYPSNASAVKDGDVWKLVLNAPTSIETANVALSATEVVVRDADIEIEIDSVTLGAATLVKDVDYTIDEASVLKAKDVGEYTVTISGIGNYAGSASAAWKIVAPTGEFAEDAMSVKKGDPAYGRIAPETPRRLDITNTVALVYRNDEQGERWEAAVEIRWPHEQTSFETVLFQQVATSVRYTDAKRAAVAVGDESVVFGDDILGGECNWLSATTGSASYYEINGLTSIKKFDYAYFDTLTWTVPINVADVVAAIESGAKHLDFSITCGSVAWGDGTEGDLYGVKDTEFTVSLSLAKVFLLDDSGNQVYPQHTHDWRYSLSEDGAALSAKCAADGCFLAGSEGGFYVSIASKDSMTPEYAEGHYRDGKPAEAFLDGAEEFAHTGAVIGEVKYMDANGGELADAPVEPGVYSACATVTADGEQGEAGSWTLRIDGLEILAGEAVVDGVHVKDAAEYLERATGDAMEISAGKSYTAARTYVVPKKYGTLSLLNCGKKTYDLAGFAVTAAVDSPLFENNGSLVIRDSSESATGTISANQASVDDVVIVNTGTLVIEGGTFVGSIINEGGNVTLSGGRFSVKPDESFVADGFDLIKRSGYWCVEKHEHKYVVHSVADRFLVAACMNVLADGTLQISHCTGRMMIGVVGIRKLGLIPQTSVDYDRKEHPAEFYAINLTGVAELLSTGALLDAVKSVIESDPTSLDSDGLQGLLAKLAQNADLEGLLSKVGNVFVSESQFEAMTGATIGEIFYFTDGELIEGKPVEVGRYTAALEVETAAGDKLTLMGTYKINEKELPIETEGHSLHVWTFNADGAKVTATCPGNVLMGIPCNASPMGLELVPSVEGGSKVFDAKPLEVTVSNLNTFVINTDADVSEVVYVAADGTESSSAPVEPGEYTAKVEVASGTLIGALIKHTATLPLTIEEKKPEGKFTVDGWTRHVGTGTAELKVIDGVLHYPVELCWPYSLEQILFTPRFTDPAHAEVRISTVRRTFSGEELIRGEGEPWALAADAGEFFRIARFSNQTYMKSVTWLVPFTFEEIDEARAAGETEIVRTITLEGKCWENDMVGLAATTYTIILDVADLVVNDPDGHQIYPVHNHAWIAENAGSTLTLVCGADGCPQAPGLVAELSFGSINKTYDSKAAVASLTGADAMRIHASVEFGEISYVEIGEGEEEIPLVDEVPGVPGRYRAMVDYSDGGDIAGTLSAEFEILPIDVSELFAYFSDSRMEFVYSGEEVGPRLSSVWYGLVPLKQGTDYTIEGDFRCVETGDYSFSVVGIGNYAGTLEYSWKIVVPTRPFASDALKVGDGDSEAPSWGEISEDGMSVVVVNATNLVYDAAEKKWIAPLSVDWPANVDVLLLASAQYTDVAHAEVSANCGETYLETASFRPALSLASAEYVTGVRWEPSFTMEDVKAAFDAGSEELVFELTVGSTAWEHDASGLKATTYRLVVPLKELIVVEGAVARFESEECVGSESTAVNVAVCGGSLFRPCSVRVDLVYRTATAFDLDLANGAVDGETPKGGLKFPLTLAWDTGDVAPKVISIPLKADKLVEDVERFMLQLSDAIGIGMGDPYVCTVDIVDANEKSPRSSVTPYKPKKGEVVATNEVVVSASPEDGGFVSGSGLYAAGTKLAMVAEARPGWTFMGWRDVDSGEIVSEKQRYQIVVSEDASFCAEFQHQVYIRGIAEPSDGAKVTGSGYCPEGKRLTLRATVTNWHFKFLRWENEEGETVATTSALVIDRTAKPLPDSKASTTVANVTQGSTFYAVFSSDPRVSAMPVAFTAEGDAVLSDGGKVSGAGYYVQGKKATLRATANKGYAFAGWYDAVSGELLSQAASLTLVTPEEGVDLFARFVTVEDDAASVSLAVDGVEMSQAAVPTYTNYCGVAVNWPVEASALSAPTVKASGLPAGVKLVQDKATGAWTLAGAPTAASKTDKAGDMTPFKVKLTVTTAGKSKQEYAFDWTVLPLPKWAVGKFDGEVEEVGTVALTVAANGKISGKMLEGGRTWTLNAATFSRVEGDPEGGSPVFFAAVVGKVGKAVVTNNLEVAAVVADDVEVGVATGETMSEQPLRWVAYQNLWNRSDSKAARSVFKKSVAKTLELGEAGDGNNALKLTFKANGVVSFAGKVGGVAVSGSSQLVVTENGWRVTLYAPPKSGFDGWCETIPVLLQCDEQNVVTDVVAE